MGAHLCGKPEGTPAPARQGITHVPTCSSSIISERLARTRRADSRLAMRLRRRGVREERRRLEQGRRRQRGRPGWHQVQAARERYSTCVLCCRLPRHPMRTHARAPLELAALPLAQRAILVGIAHIHARPQGSRLLRGGGGAAAALGGSLADRGLAGRRGLAGGGPVGGLAGGGLAARLARGRLAGGVAGLADALAWCGTCRLVQEAQWRVGREGCDGVVSASGGCLACMRRFSGVNGSSPSLGLPRPHPRCPRWQSPRPPTPHLPPPPLPPPARAPPRSRQSPARPRAAMRCGCAGRRRSRQRRGGGGRLCGSLQGGHTGRGRGGGLCEQQGRGLLSMARGRQGGPRNGKAWLEAARKAGRRNRPTLSICPPSPHPPGSLFTAAVRLAVPLRPLLWPSAAASTCSCCSSRSGPLGIARRSGMGGRPELGANARPCRRGVVEWVGGEGNGRSRRACWQHAGR